jgi:hypothetical protein
MNAWLQKVVRTAGYFFLKVIRGTVNPHCNADRISGIEKHSGENLSMLYVGPEKRNRAFLVDTLFTVAEVVESYPARHPIRALALAQRARTDVELLLIDVDLPYSSLYRNREVLRIPQWVNHKVVLPTSKEAFIQGLPRRLRREVLRCIRKYSYTYDLVDTERAFRDFYYDFYMPFIKSRFGSESVIVDERFFLSECRLGCLLRLLRCGVPVAGAILQRVHTELRSVWVGCSPTHGSTGSTGASDVLDYFTFGYALSQGCRRVDLGPTRPLLNDGVFRYKRKWGAQVHQPKLPSGDILLCPLTFTRAVRSVLENNFWITREQGKLAGHLLVEGQTITAAELHHIAETSFGSGMKLVKLRSCSGFNSAIIHAAAGIPGVSLIFSA